MALWERQSRRRSACCGETYSQQPREAAVLTTAARCNRASSSVRKDLLRKYPRPREVQKRASVEPPAAVSIQAAGATNTHRLARHPRKPVKTWTDRDRIRLFFFRKNPRENFLDQDRIGVFWTMQSFYNKSPRNTSGPVACAGRAHMRVGRSFAPTKGFDVGELVPLCQRRLRVEGVLKLRRQKLQNFWEKWVYDPNHPSIRMEPHPHVVFKIGARASARILGTIIPFGLFMGATESVAASDVSTTGAIDLLGVGGCP